MKKFVLLIVGSAVFLTIQSCDNFIDVVPKKTATIEKSFKQRAKAHQYLYTVYSYMPDPSKVRYSSSNPALLGGHDLWLAVESRKDYQPGYYLQFGEQQPNDPYFDLWNGQGTDLYEGIRKANIFIKNIDKVVNMSRPEKEQWKSEAVVLKAYFYFLLTRVYGPVVLHKKNVPVQASQDKILQTRTPVDEMFRYEVSLIDSAIANNALPDIISSQQNYGRIDKLKALAIKAKIQLTAASPLFNGNNLYKGYKNKNGVNPFFVEYNPAKWDSAAKTCKRVIDLATENGFHLYHGFQAPSNTGIDDSTQIKMNIRNSFTMGESQQNPEVIWAVTGGDVRQNQRKSFIKGLNPQNLIYNGGFANSGPPLRMVEMFYSNHGVPIKWDKTRNYDNRFKIKKVSADQKYYLTEGYETVQLNMNREPRFYADLSFDGNVWFGNFFHVDRYENGPESYRHVKSKSGQVNGIVKRTSVAGADIRYSTTGYNIKKWINWQTTIPDQGNNNSVRVSYNWPKIRLAEVYLWYAEAKNEADGPGPQVYEYLNKVRMRAGVLDVQNAYTNWAVSGHSDDYANKDGLRKIIHQELLIETAFEGKQYWLTRRWLTAQQNMNKPVRGFNILGKTADEYYKPVTLFDRAFFTPKNYFRPLKISTLHTNPKLTQNPGW